MAKRILVVDDERFMVEAVVARLKANSYETLVAYDGLEGLEKAQNEHPDLIILDLMLPKLDGYKVCRMLKFDKKHKGIPIIIFTSRAREEDKKTGMEVGADAYITKPFDPQVLLDTIKKLIGNTPVEPKPSREVCKDTASSKPTAPKEVKVNDKPLENYQSHLARWLRGKDNG